MSHPIDGPIFFSQWYAAFRFKIGVEVNIKLFYKKREGKLRIKKTVFKDDVLENVVIIV